MKCSNSRTLQNCVFLDLNHNKMNHHPFQIPCQTSFRISQMRHDFNIKRIEEKYANINEDEVDIIDITTLKVSLH